ncbi:MAG: DUF4143 domain-containing protein, partial [Chitinivibrionales bacterium]|nr:DUF4143 domain-containing protein [Chitinivibrionales bacterium]
LYDRKMSPAEFYPSHINTYVERDVRMLRNVEDLGLFERFVKLCAGRIGQLVNLSSLASECGVSHTTAEKWISLLQASYVVYLLRPHHRNFGKRVVKTPKLYFYDIGLACSLLEIHSPRHLATYYQRGSLFECAMMSELLKVRYNRARRPNYYFWRDKTGHEIDCLVENADHLQPIEFKSGRTLTEDSFKGLDYYRRLGGDTPGALVYGGITSQKRTFVHVLRWQDVDKVPSLHPTTAY